MPIVNVKSPEIMQADAEAERQRYLDQIAPRMYDRTAEYKMELAAWQATGFILALIVVCALALRVVTYLVLGV